MIERDPLVVYVRLKDGPLSDRGHVVDPVCGRELEGAFAPGRVIHGGVEYGFCSLSCARTFAAHPKEFVE
jgi:YHS domain-containing protein